MGYEMVDRDYPLEGEKMLWGVATAGCRVFKREWLNDLYLRFHKDTKRALDYIRDLDGIVGVHRHGRAFIWLFKTENEAIRGKNLMDAVGIRTSEIGVVFVDDDE